MHTKYMYTHTYDIRKEKNDETGLPPDATFPSQTLQYIDANWMMLFAVVQVVQMVHTRSHKPKYGNVYVNMCAYAYSHLGRYTILK